MRGQGWVWLLACVCVLGGCVKSSPSRSSAHPEVARAKPRASGAARKLSAVAGMASSSKAPTTRPARRVASKASAKQAPPAARRVKAPAPRREKPKPVVLAAFQASSLAPYFAGKPYRKLRRNLRWRRCKKAADIAKTLPLTKEQKQAFTFKLGRCYQRRRKYKEAHAQYALLREQKYLLRDYVAYWEAELWEREKKKEKAHALLLSIEKNSRLYRYSRLRVAEARYKARKYKGTIEVLKEGGLLERKIAVAWLLAARAYLRQKTPETHKEGLKWLRKIWVELPASGEAQVVRRLRWRRKNRFRLTPKERIRRAYRLTRFYAYKQAVSTLRGLKLAADAPQKLHCRLHYLRGFAWFRRRIYYRAVRSLLKANKACEKHPYEQVRVLYRLGQAYRRRGLTKKGFPYLRELVRRFPKHFLADDAVFMEAYALERRGKHDEARKLYASLQQRYPNGDMTTAALWRQAYRAYRRWKTDEAKQRFAALYTAHPKSRHAPAALYFHARIWHKRGKREARKKASVLYTRLIQEYPLHYYSFLALARMRRLHRRRWILPRTRRKRKKKARKHRRKRKKKARKRRRRKRLVLPWGPLPRRVPELDQLPTLFDGQKAAFLTHPRYKKGLALYRLGMQDIASLEWLRLRNCKIFPPKDKSRTHSKRPRRRRCGVRGDSGATLLALHFTLAGQFHMADRAFRRRGKLPGFLPFNKQTHKVWYLAYPKPFWKNVHKASTEHQVPLPLIYGLMREESTFKPTIQSWANAYGLMQLLLSTARAMGKKVFPGKKLKPEDLYLPEINIPLGVRYLYDRLQQFDQKLAVAIGSYNAGPKLIKRFLKSYGALQLDEWVEAISIKQTRRYIKRVLQSYAIYHLLYHQDGRRSGTLAALAPWIRPRSILQKHTSLQQGKKANPN